MTRKTVRLTSGLLPHQILALGAAKPDDEKAFRAANATYRAIRALEFALSLRWLGALKARRRAPVKNIRPASISSKGTLSASASR